MLSALNRFSLPILSFFCISLCLRIFFLGNHDLLTEEAYYWNYAAHLDYGYLDHPPMVAVLIKLFTTLFGQNEFAVRCPALCCWGISAYFIYRWCELIQNGSGQYAVLLLSILPFFFLNACITTPDMPLMAAWAGALYYLYQALCLHKKCAWYGAGICIGLGLVAKYSIALLILTTGLFLIAHREHRKWLLRKEPYLAALLIVLLFSPVIYWNATHAWASFFFQSTRRLQGHVYFALHHLLGVVILFLTPLGILGGIKLFQRAHNHALSLSSKQFIQVFLLGPLLVFSFFACFRPIKLDWIGPTLLAILPWLACHMQDSTPVLRHWLRLSPFLIGIYALILGCLTYGQPVRLNQKLFNPLLSVSWQALTEQFYQIATDIKAVSPATNPIFVPLDTYRIESEFAFYQHKQWMTHPNLRPFPVHHAAMFGIRGLMFEWWDTNNLQGKTVIFISKERNALRNETLLAATQSRSPVHKIWGKSQSQGTQLIPYYYQIAQVL